MKGYVDVFALPLKKRNVRAYARMSQRMGKVMRELGALEYHEFLGDDLNVKGTTGFPSKIKLKKGEVLVTAVVGFRSKAHRNQVNKRVMKDPRVLKMIQEFSDKPLHEHKRMLYGGFETFVKV